MECSNKDCTHKNLKESDFYVQDGRNEIRKICKYCVKEYSDKKRKEKLEFKKMYGFV